MMSFWFSGAFFVFSVINALGCVECNEPHTSYHLSSTVNSITKRIVLTHSLKSTDDNFLNVLQNTSIISQENLNPLLDTHLANVTEKCVKDVYYIFKNPKTIGVKFLDSFGKPESGLLEGNMKWLGDFSECLKIKVPLADNGTWGGFQGKYCSLTVATSIQNMTASINIGTCIPSSCNPSTAPFVQKNNAIVNALENFGLPPFVSTLTCQPISRKLSTPAIAMIVIISVFAALSFVGSSITVYEYFFTPPVKTVTFKSDDFVNGDVDRHSVNDEDDEVFIVGRGKSSSSLLKRTKPFFECFCFLKNGAKILDTSVSEGQLPSLHGIRFLSMSWVIVCHTYVFAINSTKNLTTLLSDVDTWLFQIILNGFFSVDSFFVLSGFLVAYLFFEQCSRSNGKFPWAYFYIHRYIRLTPVYMIVLGFYSVLFVYFGSGPLWPNYEVEPLCQKRWWYNILYINNFNKEAEMCMAWSWYLANDMQFFVISPIFLISLLKWPVVGISLIGLFLTANCTLNFVLTYQYNLPSGFSNILNKPITDLLSFIAGWLDYFDIIYSKPYTRIGPYLIGIALAYYLFVRKQRNAEKYSKLFLLIGWAVASAVTLACQFGLYHADMTTALSSFYNAFSRTCFACGLAWIIFVCVTGQGGFVNAFLSWAFWIPLSRLTYCAYLVHPIVIVGFFSALKDAIFFSHMAMVTYFFGLLIFSYALAFVTSLLFESPIIRLEKYIRTRFTQ